jgi:CheY-like chemotaxis protein/DNA-directed RNA polymerase specialized sigma24 family protein
MSSKQSSSPLPSMARTVRLSRPRGFPFWALGNIISVDSDLGGMTPSTSLVSPLVCFWPPGTGLDGLRFFICVSFASAFLSFPAPSGRTDAPLRPSRHNSRQIGPFRCNIVFWLTMEPWAASGVHLPAYAQWFRSGGDMSTSQTIAQDVPFLRRYARALTGSQTSGDAYVTATLEAMITDRSILDEDDGARVALFRLFTKIWNSLSINATALPDEPLRPGEQKLGNVMPLPRQAFLLVALEGFDESDAARILDVDVVTLRRLIEESGRELAAQIATDVLIIEDEPFIAMQLEGLIENLGHRVIGVASTHGEAIALMRDKRPGLILSDIQLADGSSGLDAVNELLRTFEVPVIFITAFPERFLTGERPEPAFLIAKPFQPAMVSAIASQALFFERNARRRERPVPA